jgi:hypothetical protein
MKAVSVFFQKEGEEEVKEFTEIPSEGERILIRCSYGGDNFEYEVRDVVHYSIDARSRDGSPVVARVYVHGRKDT